MTEIQAPVNQAATEVNKVIQTIENICLPIAEKAIETYVPALALPVVKQIVETIEQGIADYITRYEQLGATFIVIDIQKGNEVSSVSDALANLISAEKSGDQNAIQQAIAEFQKAQSSLVKDDGSSPPTA